MTILNIVESNNGEIIQILPFPVENDSNEIMKKAEDTFIKIINEKLYPITLSDDSEKYWIEKRIYHYQDYKLQIVISHTE
jgi:hypothetical protein